MKPATLTAAVTLCLLPLASSTEAAPFQSAGPVAHRTPNLIETVQYRPGAARGGFAARGPQGGVVAGRGAAVARPPGYRPARPIPPGAAWVRPPNYWWRPGAAVAAGAALGFITASAAANYVAPPAPGPGYCWYYTDQQRTQGFWDVCPR
ncbi:hypothetical protein [Microvirga puerhi]|uniref:Lectin-like protein BA14k n=1 Tax=Microvirga puerhi TaxID=2876078 RepID=A0ABS7VGT9_9HYPH|nr:hypothetical protein [Microvirga puerhi]MBZ6074721.1 hypothetical protein [Microvirga puerhi]